MVWENWVVAHEAIKEVEKLRKQLAEKPKEVEVADYDEVFDIYLNAFNDAGRKLRDFVKEHEEYKESARLSVRNISSSII